ncbi:phospholipid-binding lipoprotein MlaA [Nitrosospira sp. Nsp18]|nr:phospholipid-binding lipoprotein MlaA [Nitrosospira sp. Nsp18]
MSSLELPTVHSVTLRGPNGSGFGINLDKLSSIHYLTMKHSHPAKVLLLICTILFTGCATVGPRGQSTDATDPHEHINRKSYDFTDMLDRKILKPVADVYIDYVPSPVRRSVGNFYDNLGYPDVILNDFLQGKVRQGFNDTLRLTVNTTIGIAGLFDVASRMGLPQHDEDFGQTLGVWGVDAKSYLFIPLLGPSSYRDAFSIPVDVFTNILFYVGTFLGPYAIGTAIAAPLSILGIIDMRARLSGPMQLRDQAALDPYLFVRDAYLQQRKHLIYDGSPPPESYDDQLEEEPANKPSN